MRTRDNSVVFLSLLSSFLLEGPPLALLYYLLFIGRILCLVIHQRNLTVN